MAGNWGGPSNVSSGKNQRIAAPAESNGGGLGLLGFATLGAWVAGEVRNGSAPSSSSSSSALSPDHFHPFGKAGLQEMDRGASFGEKVRAGRWDGGVQSAPDRPCNEKLQARSGRSIARFEKINKDVYSLPWVVSWGRPNRASRKCSRPAPCARKR